MSDTIHIGTCHCGGYGQCISEPGEEGLCHIDFNNLLTDEYLEWIEGRGPKPWWVIDEVTDEGDVE